MREPKSLKALGIGRIEPTPRGFFVLYGKRSHTVRHRRYGQYVARRKTSGVESTHLNVYILVFVHIYPLFPFKITASERLSPSPFSPL